MPKTVTQVVHHLTNILAKKVAQAQGEQAIKSSDTWDWSRLPGKLCYLARLQGIAEIKVLASEIEGSIKEMEQAIHTAGQGQLFGLGTAERS